MPQTSRLSWTEPRVVLPAPSPTFRPALRSAVGRRAPTKRGERGWMEPRLSWTDPKPPPARSLKLRPSLRNTVRPSGRGWRRERAGCTGLAGFARLWGVARAARGRAGRQGAARLMGRGLQSHSSPCHLQGGGAGRAPPVGRGGWQLRSPSSSRGRSRRCTSYSRRSFSARSCSFRSSSRLVFSSSFFSCLSSSCRCFQVVA